MATWTGPAVPLGAGDITHTILVNQGPVAAQALGESFRGYLEPALPLPLVSLLCSDSGPHISWLQASPLSGSPISEGLLWIASLSSPAC